MLLLMRRLSRTGVAPGWFYVLAAAGFAGLAVFAMIQGDWIIAVIAAVMIAATAMGAVLMRKVVTSSALREVEHER